MSSTTRWAAHGSSATRWVANGASATRWVANGSSATRWAANGSSATRWAARRADTQKTWDFWPAASALANLARNMTINLITKSPEFLYLGDATTSIWPAAVGTALAIGGSGSDVLPNQGSPTLATIDDSVKFQAGKAFQAPTATPGDIATEDVVIEFVLIPGDSDGYVMCKDGAPYWVVQFASNQLRFDFSDGTGGAAVVSATLVPGAAYHCMLFLKRDGSGQWYVNRLASGSPGVVSARQLTLTNAAKLTFGNNSAFSASKWDGYIAYAGMYLGDDWLDSHLQPVLAEQRFLGMLDMWPALARGVYAPITCARNCIATLDKMESGASKLYTVGAGWPRVCSRPNAAAETIGGYLPEEAATQYCHYTEAVDSWTIAGAASVTADQKVAPDGKTSGDLVTVDTNSDYVGVVGTAGTADAAAAPSFWMAQADTVGVVRCLQIYSGSLGAWDIDLALLSADFERITKDHAAVTVNSAFVNHSSGGTGILFDAHAVGSAKSFYLWGAQYEENAARRTSSYINNAGTGSVTRLKDELQFAGANNWPAKNRIRIEAVVLFPDEDTAANQAILYASDGGAGADHAGLYHEASTETVYGVATSTEGGSIAADGGVDISDGDSHSLRFDLKASTSATVSVDGAAGTPDDADILIPDDIDELDIGQEIGSASQPGGLINRIKIKAI